MESFSHFFVSLVFYFVLYSLQMHIFLAQLQFHLFPFIFGVRVRCMNSQFAPANFVEEGRRRRGAASRSRHGWRGWLRRPWQGWSKVVSDTGTTRHPWRRRGRRLTIHVRGVACTRGWKGVAPKMVRGFIDFRGMVGDINDMPYVTTRVVWGCAWQCPPNTGSVGRCFSRRCMPDWWGRKLIGAPGKQYAACISLVGLTNEGRGKEARVHPCSSLHSVHLISWSEGSVY